MTKRHTFQLFATEKLFDVHPTKSYKMTNNDLYAISGNTPVVSNSSINNGVGGYIGRSPTEKSGTITFSDTTVGAETMFYQPVDFIGYSHVQGLYPKGKHIWTERESLYFISTFRKAAGNDFDYANKFNRDVVNKIKTELPIQTDSSGSPILDPDCTYHDKGYIPDWEYMENYIRELEAKRIRELEAYLQATGLDDTRLTDKEKETLSLTKTFQQFSVLKLFGKSTRGKRLKSLDRIPGNLPFVTAGEENTGISAYIGNNVEIFQPNTSTIDMFGSAKFRDYHYGGDDHVAIVHTEYLNKYAAQYVTCCLHKSAHNGLFSYSRNFYAKDADALFIMLPIQTSNSSPIFDPDCTYHDEGYIPDWEYMENYIRALEKQTIERVMKDRELFISTAKEVAAS